MNKYKNILPQALLLIVGLMNTPSFAQVTDKVPTKNTDIIKDLPAEQVEVIKQFQARLEDARKINITPELPAQRKLEGYAYTVNIRPMELEYPEPSIRPVAMLQDPKPAKYNAYLLAGYGNLNTINIAAGYHFMTKQETEFTLSGDFLKMNNPKELLQKFQKINAGVAVKHSFNPMFALVANANYNRKDIFFFGSEIDSTIAENTPELFQRSISKYGFGVKALNSERNDYRINYQLGIDYENVQITNDILAENNFIANLDFSKGFNDHFSMYLNGIVDITTILYDETINYNNYFINPGIRYGNDKILLNAGINFAFDQNGNYYLPDVNLSYNFGNTSIIPFLFAKGDLQKNNLSSLFDVNPFLNENIIPNIENSVVYKYGGGLKGGFKNMNYETQISYGNTQNLILFQGITTDDNLKQFEILKDTANILEIKGGIDYTITDDLSLNADVTFRNYDLKENERPWHLPTYQFDFNATYQLLDNKLKINPGLYLRQGVFVLNENGEEEQLNPLIDFNLNVAYDVYKGVSVFGRVNNILASEYQLWDNYSFYGLNAIAGIKAVF